MSLLAVQSVDELRTQTRQSTATYIQFYLGRHWDIEKDGGGNVGNLGVLESDFDIGT